MNSNIAGTGSRSAPSGIQRRAASAVPSDTAIRQCSISRTAVPQPLLMSRLPPGARDPYVIAHAPSLLFSSLFSSRLEQMQEHPSVRQGSRLDLVAIERRVHAMGDEDIGAGLLHQVLHVLVPGVALGVVPL